MVDFEVKMGRKKSFMTQEIFSIYFITSAVINMDTKSVSSLA